MELWGWPEEAQPDGKRVELANFLKKKKKVCIIAKACYSAGKFSATLIPCIHDLLES